MTDFVEMLECQGCKWPYPATLISTMDPMPCKELEYLCGICALELINSCTGSRSKKFRKKMPELLRTEAVGWRMIHPELEPKPILTEARKKIITDSLRRFARATMEVDWIYDAWVAKELNLQTVSGDFFVALCEEATIQRAEREKKANKK